VTTFDSRDSDPLASWLNLSRRFVVYPPGEVREYENRAVRSMSFRVRYGVDMRYDTVAWATQLASDG